MHQDKLVWNYKCVGPALSSSYHFRVQSIPALSHSALQVVLEMEVSLWNQIFRRNLLWGVWGVWGVCILLLLLPCEAGAPKALFIFGDSLSDPGNNNYINTLARANTPPNGMDFPGGCATGRFTNGRTTVDILGQFGGLKTFIPPYLAPNTTGNAILSGVNYASGAGGILDSTGYLVVGRISMNKQLEYFGNTKAQILSLLGEAAGMELISTAIFASNMGSNDYLANFYDPLSPIGNLTSAQLATLLVRDYHAQLTRLYNMGARKVVVASLGPIGCTPYQLTLRFSKNGECNEKANVDVKLFNVGLLAMVKQLNAELPGAHFLYADAYKGFMDMIINPSQYGFKVVDQGCCGAGGNYKGLIPCLAILKPCTNRLDYLFWDPYHPTDKANAALAIKYWKALVKFLNTYNPNHVLRPWKKCTGVEVWRHEDHIDNTKKAKLELHIV